jgi:hypothetical protein
MELSKQLQALQAELEDKEMRWLELSEMMWLLASIIKNRSRPRRVISVNEVLLSDQV